MEKAILLPTFAKSTTSYNPETATLPRCFQGAVRRHYEMPCSMQQPLREMDSSAAKLHEPLAGFKERHGQYIGTRAGCRGWRLVPWDLIHPLIGVVFSPAGCPYHPLYKAVAESWI